jgi:hypothetical protein
MRNGPAVCQPVRAQVFALMRRHQHQPALWWQRARPPRALTICAIRISRALNAN